MNPEEALKILSTVLQTPKYCNIPYTIGAKINEAFIVLDNQIKSKKDV